MQLRTLSQSATRPASHSSLCTRSRPLHRSRVSFLTAPDQLVVEASPFAMTHNAQFFYARRPPEDPNRDETRVAVVKTTQLHLDHDSAQYSRSDDPIYELLVFSLLAKRGGHPNVVTCLGAFVQNDTTHLLTEYCSGGDLFSRLQATPHHRLSQHDALDALRQIAQGLQFLHECEVAHRDVSLENVLVGDDGLYKLCDFGLATEIDELSVEVVGKQLYMAPEVVAETPYDAVARANAGDFEAFRQLGVRGVVSQWGLTDRFSEETLALLDGMLQVDPIHRFQDLAGVLNHPALA